MRRDERENEGVSAVIAVILMVAITVVLAGVLYVWVMGIVNPETGTTVSIGLTRTGERAVAHATVDPDPVYYVYTVTSGRADLSSVEINIVSAGLRRANFALGVTASDGDSIYPADWDGDEAAPIHVIDNNADGYLNSGDVIRILKGPGGVNTGDEVQISVGGSIAARIQI